MRLPHEALAKPVYVRNSLKFVTMNSEKVIKPNQAFPKGRMFYSNNPSQRPRLVYGSEINNDFDDNLFAFRLHLYGRGRGERP